MMKSLLGMATCLALLPGCMTVSSISTSQIPPAKARSHKVVSSASNFVVLFIPFGNSFVQRAREDLERQCPKGSIEGIQSKHEDIHYFTALLTKQQITMQGYCLSPRSKG